MGFATRLVLFTSLFLASFLLGSCADTYVAKLNGDEVVPTPVKTNSSGTVEIIFNPRVIKDSTADYNITLKGVTGVTSVQLQKGTKGNTGDVVAYLYGPNANAANTTINGVFTTGELKRANLTGPLNKDSINDLQDNVNDNKIYVGLYTLSSGGTPYLRGQLQKQ